MLVGIAMIFLPGPAFVVIPIGLAILATEFIWARRLMKRARALLPRGNNQLPKSDADGQSESAPDRTLDESTTIVNRSDTEQ